jgi:redox-sensitive bicupin YhaK (pirin superfamily)
MEKLSPGQIYLADQRGVIETEGLTRWSTCNYGDYFDAHKKAFGPLLTLNDELFMPAYKANYQPAQAVWMVIIPITGEVAYKDDLGNSGIVDVGQVQLRYIPAKNIIELANPYNDERINFLYMEFKAGDTGLASLIPQLYDFDFEGKQNTLIDVVTTSQPDSLKVLPFSLHIGMFDGRHDALYQVKEGHLFFAFVIAGAFELQGRLMHQRDGLALWDLHEADMEALSNNAVVMVLQMKNQVTVN